MASSAFSKTIFGVGQAAAWIARSSRQHHHPMRILGGFRTLYASDAIGVNGYEKQRERTRSQFAGMTDKFRTKMQEFSSTDSKNMIFTEDLKNMLHLVEHTPEDLQLILQMMKKFNHQNKHLRFGNFIFGPVVMRMYHHLNDPSSAVAAFKDPELDGFFDQLASYQILCDLLHRNGLYQEVLDVFETIKSKQVQMTKYPRNVMVLVFASLYKLNNVQSYELALKYLQEMKDVGVDPIRRVLTYACCLALNQNAPSIALEVLSSCKQANYVTIRNLKIWALSELGRPDDALPILRWSLEFDNPGNDSRASVCPDVLEKIAMAVDKLANNEVTVEFQRIHKALTETKQISQETLDQHIDAEIAAVQTNNNTNFDVRRQSTERSFRIGRSIDLKPRRNPAFERDRRSLRSE